MAETTAGSGTCFECGQSFPSAEMVRLGSATVCAKCKPIHVQKIKEGGLVGSAMKFASFWQRFGALILDGIILMIVNSVVSLVFIGGLTVDPTAGAIAGFLVAWTLQMVISAAYEIGFTGRFGATPGKMALNLKVVNADGSAVSYGKSTARYFSKFVSAIILLIGYIMAAFDDEGRSLHDRICETRVIKSN